MMMLVRPAATASSMTYWMIGLSTRGSISLGCALVAGRKRVPRPAAGKTALRTRPIINSDANTGPRGPCGSLASFGELMLDLKWVVENWDQMQVALRSRGQDPPSDIRGLDL